jgi:hypothetical protein
LEVFHHSIPFQVALKVYLQLASQVVILAYHQTVMVGYNQEEMEVVEPLI